jgi:hypothetical protein
MIKHILIAAISAGTILMAGSGNAMVTSVRVSYHSAPTYCYDCHPRPVWNIGYARCGYRSIRIAHDGYYYRPFRYGRHENFRFRRFNFSHEKQIRGRR